jgi:glycosyltransferase involved in cell wall biosynthesis
VDNNSRDSSREIALNFINQNPLARLVIEKNPGPASARNRGVSEAKGEIIAFTDSDCYVTKTWLSCIAHAFTTADSRVAGIGGAIKVYRSHRPIFQYYRYRQILDQEKFFKTPPLGTLPFLATANFSVRRNIFLAMSGFDKRLFPSEDADFSWRVQWSGWKLLFDSRCIVYHHFREDLGSLFHTARKYGYGNMELRAIHKQHLVKQPCWEFNRWLWLLKAVLKIPWSFVKYRHDPFRRYLPYYDMISNSGYIYGKVQGVVHTVLKPSKSYSSRLT